MLNAETRQTIVALHRAGESYRSIARRLRIDRKTVGGVIESGKNPTDVNSNSRIEVCEDLLRTLYKDCNGWVQRMHEKLIEEHGITIAYSTLTLRCRELGLGNNRKKNRRAAHVETGPGEEMQHDTSPYVVKLGGKAMGVVASVIYLRYSKMIYLKFYLHFRRYDMKCFLHEALKYFGGSAQICVIDNTNLARLLGSGASAIIHHEMESYSRRYGFEFICHEIKHSDRKAGNERCFRTVETNFLPGRTFRNLDDLNAQALQWATVRMAKRPHDKTKLIPAEIFEYERDYLTPFTPDLPGPTRSYSRSINPYGFVPIDANEYWVPGEKRGTVSIIEYPGRLEIFRERDRVVEYEKISADICGQKLSPKGTDLRPARRKRPRPTAMEEAELRKLGASVGDYIDFLLIEARGIRAHNIIRLIHGLSRRITATLFIRTIQRSCHYRITDFSVIENIASMLLAESGLSLPRMDIDPDLEKRQAFMDGETSPAPDLDVYDMPTEDEIEETPDNPLE